MLGRGGQDAQLQSNGLPCLTQCRREDTSCTCIHGVRHFRALHDDDARACVAESAEVDKYLHMHGTVIASSTCNDLCWAPDVRLVADQLSTLCHFDLGAQNLMHRHTNETRNAAAARPEVLIQKGTACRLTAGAGMRKADVVPFPRSLLSRGVLEVLVVPSPSPAATPPAAILLPTTCVRLRKAQRTLGMSSGAGRFVFALLLTKAAGRALHPHEEC